MPALSRNVLLLAWAGLLALTGLYVQRTLSVGADLRLFLPEPATPEERLLLEEVGESPASRLLLVALAGSVPEALAESSQALAEALRADPAFRFVANGDAPLDAVPEALLPYRYLLAETLDTARFDAEYLRGELQARVRDLASPAAGLLEPWLPRDPTLEILMLAEAWQPGQEPQRLHDVWFDAAGERALLLVETAAAAFDPEGQRLASEALRQHFAATRAGPEVRLIASGPGAFSVLMKERTQSEAQWLGGIASAGILILLLAAYRNPRFVLLGALPLASAGLAGLASVSALFGTVHGITLAFGFTLLGVAQDYPMHLFSHQRPGQTPLATARALWPTLATGVASTCIAYLAFLASGVIGLAQLACFTVSGLAVAGLTTRYLLPRLLGGDSPAGAVRDYGESRLLERLRSALGALPRVRWLGVALAAAAVAVLGLAPWPMWQNDLSTLTPVPRPLLEQDMQLRAELGAPDVRHLLTVGAGSADALLARLEGLDAELEALVRAGALAGFDHAARYLPSRAVQERRRAALPEAGELRAALAAAARGLPFRAGVFEPFVADVQRARRLEPLRPEMLAGTPLALRLESLLRAREGRWTGLITLAGVTDPQALAAFAAAAGPDVTLLDLKGASEQLVARQRTHILWSLGVAALLLIGVVAIALREARRVRRVIAPMALTTLLVLALLHGAGVSFSLFHLIALVLAAGLGLDYALFFERASGDAHEQRRTLHAVIVCALSTFMVFALLAASSLPVLRAIGLTVALGVLGNFVLALLITRPPVPAVACSNAKPLLR